MTPEIKRMILKRFLIGVMLRMAEVLLTFKFFVTLTQGAKVSLQRQNQITFYVSGDL